MSNIYKLAKDMSLSIINEAVKGENKEENKEALNIVISEGNKARVTLLSGKVKEVPFNSSSFIKSLEEYKDWKGKFSSVVITICDEVNPCAFIVSGVANILNLDLAGEYKHE